MSDKKFAIIGGDMRNAIIAELLQAEDYDVKLYGFGNYNHSINVARTNNLHTAIDHSDVIIGPVPCSIDNITLNAPFSDCVISVVNIFESLKKNQLFLAGHISDKIKQLTMNYNTNIIDFLDREELAVLNAIPTAEGAIQVAMEELPITINGSNSLVLGYGRIGKILCKMLSGLGSNVHACARKPHDIAWIKSNGHVPVHFNNLNKSLNSIDVVFNTVPSLILDKQKLVKIKKDCLVIDLASKPGGVDIEAAKNIGIKSIWALSLPGKVAPYSAAMAIKETILNILDELEV